MSAPITYWHRAARLLRAYLREVEAAESGLSDEVLEEGKAHRHWRCVAEDAQERITELEAELAQERAEFDRLRAGMLEAAEAFHTARLALQNASPADLADQFARDHAPHINLMGAMGDPDYLKGHNSCRHIDLREKKPREKRVPQ